MTKAFVQQLFTGKLWESGIFKTETEEHTWASETGLVGDEIADKKNHGGLEKAIFSYPVNH